MLILVYTDSFYFPFYCELLYFLYSTKSWDLHVKAQVFRVIVSQTAWLPPFWNSLSVTGLKKSWSWCLSIAPVPYIWAPWIIRYACLLPISIKSGLWKQLPAEDKACLNLLAYQLLSSLCWRDQRGLTMGLLFHMWEPNLNLWFCTAPALSWVL